MGQGLPARFAAGGVQPVVVDAAYAPLRGVPRKGRNELRESGDEVHGVPEGGILLEVGIVGRMINDLAAGTVVAELLQ